MMCEGLTFGDGTHRYDSLSFYCLDCGLKSLEVRGLLPGGERTVRS